MTPIHATLPLTPVAKGRPRFAGHHARTPRATREYEDAIRLLMRRHIPITGPLTGPLSVSLLLVMPRPQRLSARRHPDGLVWCDRRPDIDNLVKSVLDGLSDVWEDDGQVVELHARQVYAERDGSPRVEIEITRAGRCLDD